MESGYAGNAKPVDDDAFRNYVRDLGPLLRDLALDAVAERDSAEPAEARAYAAGRVMGLHEAVSLMQQQAVAFGIEPSEVGLDDIQVDRDLI